MPAKRRSRDDYAQGLPGYHDPTAGVGGSSPARSALTLRAVLAVFGLVVCGAGAWLSWQVGMAWLAIVLVVVAVVALLDLAWVLYRTGRGEPG